ncbi:MAG: UDP-N-acetylmuramoyl-tripeptide--D-alanyl-D-alanine ligase [Actinobacteria bacterium]|nr:UDP-N-acetylmuramoyl-tripeptide--D-alanyl-D-alanine ligase [Actinomycetota bacterium]
MIPLAWDEVAELDLGEHRGAPADGVVRRVHADSREARPGDLFVALNAGVQYVEDALARGAAALVPRDQEETLAALASLVRSRSRARIVAVVGSTGKTSTKDALGALCAAVTPTVFPSGSLNNEIGLPLTVLGLEPDTDVLVAEMGMRGLGQIAALCRIAPPVVTLVSSIGPEHLELVGTVADVARANAEAIDALPAGGVAVVPDGVPELEAFLQRSDIAVRRFDPTTVERAGDRWRFVVSGGAVELELPFDQRHLAGNVLGALEAYDALGLPLDRAQEGAAAIRHSPWRGEVHELPGGGLVVNDAYNANPTSMRAALLDLTERAAGRRRVAVLGEMAELGEASAGYHEEIGQLVGELGIEAVAGVGEAGRAYLAHAAGEARWIPGAEAFADVVGMVRAGDAVLVKASRAVGLEGIAALIAKSARAW